MNRGLMLLAALLLRATDVPAGTIRFDNVVREIESCEESGEMLRYSVQGVVYHIPRKDAEVTGLVCRKVEGVTLDPKSSLSPYLRQLRAQVFARLAPPQGAHAGLSVVIWFEIGRDGRIIQGPLVEAVSGMTRFDDAALRAVRQAQPFAPLPADFQHRSLIVHIKFDLAEHQRSAPLGP
jgi:TonB family protein